MTPDLDHLDDTQLKDMQQTFAHLIDHMAHRIEYAESRRSSVATLGGALLASGLGLLPLIVSQISYLPVRFALIFSAVMWVIFGGLTWLVYARQTNFRYPFTEVAKTSKWFYRYALSDYKVFDAPWHTLQSKRAIETGKLAFDTQWNEFKDRQIQDLSDIRSHVQQDLQQVYLLHVNERYKNLFLTQIRNILFWGVTIGIGAGIVGFFIGLAFMSNGLVSMQQPITIDNLTIEASWRDTGLSRSSGSGSDETQLLLNLRITNEGRTERTITDTQLSLVDNVGMHIPVFVESVNPSPVTLPANSSGRVVILLWVPESLRATIHHMEVLP